MRQGPLTEPELEWLDDVLMEYGTEQSVLDMSELDGFLTAVLSGPTVVPVEEWLPALWGNDQPAPEWKNSAQENRFNDLVIQHMSDIAERLQDAPDQFEPMFGLRDIDGQEITVVEDWCFGYMRGVALGDWSKLPVRLRPTLQAIALHGEEENLDHLDNLTPEAFLQSIDDISPAALAIFNGLHKVH